MKYCSKCHQQKPYSEFHHMAVGWDGYRPDCRQCHNAVARVYQREYDRNLRELANIGRNLSSETQAQRK